MSSTESERTLSCPDCHSSNVDVYDVDLEEEQEKWIERWGHLFEELSDCEAEKNKNSFGVHIGTCQEWDCLSRIYINGHGDVWTSKANAL